MNEVNIFTLIIAAIVAILIIVMALILNDNSFSSQALKQGLHQEYDKEGRRTIWVK